MGTPDFSVPVLEALIASRHQVVAVVTQPDKPKGRGKALSQSPVKECALSHGLSVYQPKRVREAECVAYIGGFCPDMVVVGIWPDSSKRAIGIAPVWLCECTCFPAAPIPGGCANPVVSD